MEKPEFCTNDHLEYLDDLRESGATNIFGARPFLMDEFDLPSYKAKEVLMYWMKSFSERHQK